MWSIKIYNVGREPDWVKVFGDDHMRRAAEFSTREDAEEAVRIINMLRTDSAYLYSEVERV